MREATRFSAEAKQEILTLVADTALTHGLDDPSHSAPFGLSKARYRDWIKRQNGACLGDRPPLACLRDGILAEEKEAVKAYALAHPKGGCRRLAWQMIDAAVAYLSPSSVYRVLDGADLLYRWKRSTSSDTSPAKPTKPNERWHTDLMYLRVQDSWYFLVTVLDAYSRWVRTGSYSRRCTRRMCGG